MACPLCGDRCTCLSAKTGNLIASSRVSILIDPADGETSGNFEPAERIDRPVARGTRTASAQVLEPLRTTESSPQLYRTRATDGWRDEVASRVQAHRARRRRRFDPDASLNLAFSVPEAEIDAACDPATASELTNIHSGHEVVVEGEPGDAPSGSIEPPAPEPVTEGPYRRILVKAAPLADPVTGNLIEFPRAVSPQPQLGEELAESIIPMPRILDSPDTDLLELNQSEQEAWARPQLALPSLFAGIQLDEHLENPPWLEAPELADKMELPLQVAPIGPRVMCMLADAMVVLTAAALFCVIVLSMAKYVPQGRLAAAAAVILPLCLWSLYHYLFLRFNGTTPGMQMAQLELTSFEGCAPTRKTRSLRAASMMLSCVSLGLGFAWALVDEDTLSWHDRITRTYLRQS